MITESKEVSSKKMSFRVLILFALFLFVFGFLCIRIFQFDLGSLQMDFSAYYTAGESLNHGLSPYINNFFNESPIWDGVNYYKNSRFLYPPLVGNFFQLFALIPYQISKILWSFINLAALFYSIYCVAALLVKESHSRNQLLLLSAIGACIFFPVFTYFERGQIDAITLLLLVLGIQGLIEKKHAKSGIFFALAILIKINIIIILPIFLIRKYRKIIPVLAIMLGVFCVLTFSLNEWELVKNYVTSDFARIVKYNEGGLTENIIPSENLIKANEGYPLTYPHKQGIGYEREYFSFIGNGSLTRTLWGQEISTSFSTLPPPFADLAVNILLYLIALTVCSLLIFITKSLEHPDSEFLLWGLILTIILLISPLTWAMNLVWLTALFPVFFRQMVDLITNKIKIKGSFLRTLSLVLGGLGLFLVMIPDSFLASSDAANGLLVNKYPVGEFLIFCWLLISIVAQRFISPSPASPLEIEHQEQL